MKKAESQNGNTIIELILVLVIVSIMTTFAVSRFGKSKNTLTRQNIARELKNSLERAHFDSVKRRAAATDDMAHITIDNSSSFTVFTDFNQNGEIDSYDKKQVNLANSGIKIIGTNLLYPITIKFDHHGFMTATNNLGTKINPNFTICEDCTIANANEKNADVISISQTGTVLMTAGGESLPVYTNPQFSNINNGSQINPLVTFSPIR